MGQEVPSPFSDLSESLQPCKKQKEEAGNALKSRLEKLQKVSVTPLQDNFLTFDPQK